MAKRDIGDTYWVSHGMKNHPAHEWCEDCEKVKQEFDKAVKDAGGMRKFKQKLRKLIAI